MLCLSIHAGTVSYIPAAARHGVPLCYRGMGHRCLMMPHSPNKWLGPVWPSSGRYGHPTSHNMTSTCSSPSSVSEERLIDPSISACLVSSRRQATCVIGAIVGWQREPVVTVNNICYFCCHTPYRHPRCYSLVLPSPIWTPHSIYHRRLSLQVSGGLALPRGTRDFAIHGARPLPGSLPPVCTP
jgi:hypothetical protein